MPCQKDIMLIHDLSVYADLVIREPIVIKVKSERTARLPLNHYAIIPGDVVGKQRTVIAWIPLKPNLHTRWSGRRHRDLHGAHVIREALQALTVRLSASAATTFTDQQ